MELAAVRAARSGGRAMLLGPKLPAIAGAVRFWGGDLLVPVGFRPDPDLPPAALRAAAGATADELVFLSESGAELVPRAAFEPLSRAAARLAVGGPNPPAPFPGKEEGAESPLSPRGRGLGEESGP
jgi:hypothetical protein